MRNNINLIYSIFIYIMIMLILFIVKPDFIYNHDTKKFKAFGFDETQHQSLISIYTIGILLPISLYLFIFAIN